MLSKTISPLDGRELNNSIDALLKDDEQIRHRRIVVQEDDSVTLTQLSAIKVSKEVDSSIHKKYILLKGDGSRQKMTIQQVANVINPLVKDDHKVFVSVYEKDSKQSSIVWYQIFDLSLYEDPAMMLECLILKIKPYCGEIPFNER